MLFKAVLGFIALSAISIFDVEAQLNPNSNSDFNPNLQKLKCCGSRDFANFPPATVNFTSDTVLEINQGWQGFFFGSAGSWAMASNTSGAFYTNYKVPIIIRIVDDYITGDRFALYLNGSLLGNTTLGVYNSTTYTTLANEAWVIANYSHGEWLLPPGLHRFTIKTLTSVDPQGSGGFIRADINPAVECGNCRPFCFKGPCDCSITNASPNNPPGCCANNPPIILPVPICREASGIFSLIKVPMTRDDGIKACEGLNLRLAEINSSNFSGANQFAFVCNGNQVTNLWIRSWNTDNYQNACLVLNSGSFGGTGAITAQDCNSKNFVLCQA